MVRQAMPKQVTLPNSRTFVARYERVSRDALPLNIRIRKRYRGRPAGGRYKQGSRGILSIIKKYYQLAKRLEKIITSNTAKKLTKNLGNKALNKAPELLENLQNKSNNKTLKKSIKC